MNENGSMPTPRYIDIEAFKVSYKMAIYAGIEALKDKPIERDKAIAVMYTVFEALDAFPTATIESPRPDWTPCAEGMPKARSNDQSDDVLICYINKHGTLSVSTGWYWSEQEHWYQTNSDVPINVIAWQHLTEPYNPNKAQEERADG